LVNVAGARKRLKGLLSPGGLLGSTRVCRASVRRDRAPHSRARHKRCWLSKRIRLQSCKRRRRNVQKGKFASRGKGHRENAPPKGHIANTFAPLADSMRKTSRHFRAPAHVKDILENCEQIERCGGAKLNAQTFHWRLLVPPPSIGQSARRAPRQLPQGSCSGADRQENDECGREPRQGGPRPPPAGVAKPGWHRGGLRSWKHIRRPRRSHEARPTCRLTL